MNIGSIVGDIGVAIPFIETIVNGVESIFGSGNGPQKLDAAVSAALAALGIYAQTTGKTLPASFQSDLQAAINSIVKVKNDLGLLLPHSAVPAS